jgi:hypothetical protein
LNLFMCQVVRSRELGNKPMIKFGLKPAMTMSLVDSDNPVEHIFELPLNSNTPFREPLRSSLSQE